MTDSPSCARHGGVHCRELTGDLEVYELACDSESPPPALLCVLSALALVLGGGLSTHCVRGFFDVPLTH